MTQNTDLNLAHGQARETRHRPGSIPMISEQMISEDEAKLLFGGTPDPRTRISRIGDTEYVTSPASMWRELPDGSELFVLWYPSDWPESPTGLVGYAESGFMAARHT